MKISKKYILFLIAIIVIFSGCNTTIEKQIAEVRRKEYRSITIINRTDEKLIKECRLTTADGILVYVVEEKKDENIVLKNFDKDKVYKDEKKFKVILIDRYGLRYEKIFEASEKGNTDVIVEQTDYVSQKGDFFRKFIKFFN